MRKPISFENHFLIEEHKYPSTAQLRQLFNSSLDMICSISLDGKFVHVSPASYAILGYHREEMMDQCFLDFVHENDRQRTANAEKAIILGMSPADFENRCYRKDGTVVFLSWSCRWDAREKLMFCSARDISERKAKASVQTQYEKKVKKQDWALFDILERITDGFFAMDEEWRILYCNTQVERMLHIEREDFLTRNYWECFPEMVGSVYDEQYHKAMRENIAVHFEAYFPLFAKWFSVDAYPSQTGLSVFFRDTSEKKQAAEELQKLSLIARETSNPVWLMNTDFNITWVNNAFTHLTGYTPEEAIGKRPGALLRGLETDLNVRAVLLQKLSEGKSFEGEYVHYKKSGEQIYVHVNAQPIFDNKGNIAQYFVIETDLTERKKAETELQRLSLIAKETENGVILIDPDRKATWVNAAFTRMTGYTLEEIVGKRPAELLEGPGTDKKTIRFIQEQYKKEQPFQVEILNYKKNGEPFWSEIHIQPLFNADGALEQFFSIRKDITERKQLERQLEEQRNKTTAAAIAAQEKERAQVGQELHDNVNQVLTTVKLYAELCRDGMGDTKEIMDRSIRLLQESINEIRSLSKRLSAPTLGKIRLMESIKELVDAVAGTGKLVIRLEAAAIEELEVSQEVHLALYRILQEHLTNILKHSEARQVSVLLKFEEGVLSLQVIDNGKGFDLCTTPKGLGITSMTSRAESLGGTLHLVSAPGKGCMLEARFLLG